MIRQVLAVCLALVALPCLAGNWPELKMTAEHPIDGMRGGNLSGLVECRGGLWGVSDRDDDRIYRFDQQNPTWRAAAYLHPAGCPGKRPAMGVEVAQLGGIVHSRWRAGFRRYHL